MKKILDVCCGGRHFWFDKQHKNTIYVDKRICPPGHDHHRPNHSVSPDVQMDFRSLAFKDRQFNLIVFDPPHIKTIGKTSIYAKKYGKLFDGWESDLSAGFDECWRVLKENGVLIFKWNEYEIKLKTVLNLFSQKPLFGHTTNHKSHTHWSCFMKISTEG